MQLQTIQNRIYEIREQWVMLDFDLAELYDVETRTLKQAVRRNVDRFPPDFMFELNKDELSKLKENQRSQTVISISLSTRYAPFAFIEQGVAMLSSVLESPKVQAVSPSGLCDNKMMSRINLKRTAHIMVRRITSLIGSSQSSVPSS